MAIENDNSRVLEPDLICSKDGDILECSAREVVRDFEELTRLLLPWLLSRSAENRRF